MSMKIVRRLAGKIRSIGRDRTTRSEPPSMPTKKLAFEALEWRVLLAVDNFSYSNSNGFVLEGSDNVFAGNLGYYNTNQGIVVQNSTGCQLQDNTVYQ